MSYQTSIPATRSCVVVAIDDLPSGPCWAPPDVLEGLPGQSGYFGGHGNRQPVRVSICEITSGVAVEVDRIWSFYLKSDAQKYIAEHGAERDADVAAHGADSWSFGLLADVVIHTD